MDTYHERVYELVLRIPRGRVMTYGSVAAALGAPYDARKIGNIMSVTPSDSRSIPWHRVINAKGGVSTAGRTSPPDLQLRLLEAEGVVFNEKGCCSLRVYGWMPGEGAAGSEGGEQGNLF